MTKEPKFSSLQELIAYRRKMNPIKAGIETSQWVRVPHLSENELTDISQSGPATIVRHFKDELDDGSSLLDLALGGSFKLGTISEYKASDNALVGRFSDTEEGLQKVAFHSDSNNYSLKIGGCSLKDNYVSLGGVPGVINTYFSNDYCSCSSCGDFDLKRANLIRERGNSDLNAFVVYDLTKLLNAIGFCIVNDRSRDGLMPIVRKVDYGQKNRRLFLKGSSMIEFDRNQLKVWLDLTFTKSPDYIIEDELRIVLVDPKNVGRLAQSVQPWILNSPKISDAILESGRF